MTLYNFQNLSNTFKKCVACNLYANKAEKKFQKWEKFNSYEVGHLISHFTDEITKIKIK